MTTIHIKARNINSRRHLANPHQFERPKARLLLRFVLLSAFTTVVLLGLRAYDPPTAGATTAESGDRVSVGHRYACAVEQSGHVSCWGWNTVGQLGIGRSEGHGGMAYPTPQRVVDLSGVAAVSAGYQHACALQTSGSVMCWGAGLDGQLGDGLDQDALTPVRVAGLSDAVAISAGGDATCALRRSGAVVCWGDNRYGQMGNGTMDDAVRPTAVTGITSAVSIDMTDDTGCAAMRDGSVECWGFNSFNQIDGALGSEVRAPVIIRELSGAVDAISSTSHGVCGLSGSHVIHCVNDGDPFHSPHVGSLSADDELCVLGTNGAVVCNSFLVGVATGEFLDMGLTPSTEVEVGEDSACAVLGDGTVACWGSNRWGQLGAGHTDSAEGPLTVRDMFVGVEETTGPTMASARTLAELTQAADFTPAHADVLRLYRAFFDREPDLGGAKYWVDRFDSGTSLLDITRFFGDSVEFNDTYGPLTSGRYVYLVYRNVLDREPDAGGYAYWLGRMQDGSVDAAGLMLHFALSPEFRAANPYPA